MNQIHNRVQLIGRLGQDPEIRTFENGNMVAQFSLATSDYYKNQQGERVEDTQWHRIVAWGKLAEIAQNFLKKGKEVVIEGKLTSRSYEDRDGMKRYVTEVKAREVFMIGSKSDKTVMSK